MGDSETATQTPDTGTQASDGQDQGSQPQGSQDTGTQASDGQDQGSQPQGSQDTGTQASDGQDQGSQPQGSQDTGTQASDGQDQGSQPQGSQDTGTQGSQDAQADPQQVVREAPVLSMVDSNAAEVAPASTALDLPDTGVVSADSGLPGVAGTIVNIAKTAWDVMKDGKPTTASTDNANAVPNGATLTDLAGWDPTPRTMRLHYHSEARLGNPTDIDLTCEWYFNGQYQGAGQYINAATVIASGDVAWLNHVDITASISNPLNLGTTSNPVAALPVRIEVTEYNFLQSITSAWSGNVQGNGAGHLDPV